VSHSNGKLVSKHTLFSDISVAAARFFRGALSLCVSVVPSIFGLHCVGLTVIRITEKVVDEFLINL